MPPRAFALIALILAFLLVVLVPTATAQPQGLSRLLEAGGMTAPSSATVANQPRIEPRLPLILPAHDQERALVQILRDEWGDGAWESSERTDIAYDDNDRRSTDVLLHYSPETAAFESVSRTRYTYDDAGRIVQTLDQEWTGGGWSDSDRYTTTYDGSGRAATLLSEEHDGSDWQPWARETYQYNGDILTEITVEVPEGASWTAVERVQITHKNGDVQLVLQERDAQSGTWTNVARLTFRNTGVEALLDPFRIYEADVTADVWEDGAWATLYRIESDLNTQGNPEQTRLDVWLDTENDWFTVQRQDHTYSDGELVETVDEGLDINTGVWHNITRRSYAYAALTARESDGMPSTYHLSQNYPNPFNPTTAISFRLPATEHVRLEVFDLLGRSISVLHDEVLPAGRHEVFFDAAGLPSGAYVYRLHTPASTTSRSMLLVQ